MDDKARIRRTLAAIAERIVGRPIGDADGFDRIGFDSLDCIEFATEVEDTFGIDVSCIERVEMESITGVAAMIASKTMRHEMPMAA